VGHLLSLRSAHKTTQLYLNGQVTAVYCKWDGKDAQTVRDALTRLIAELPFSKVSTEAEIQGEDFR